ncbi:hypothetical protein AAVH_28923, partial [Aphelenchoides avenae]
TLRASAGLLKIPAAQRSDSIRNSQIFQQDYAELPAALPRTSSSTLQGVKRNFS